MIRKLSNLVVLVTLDQSKMIDAADAEALEAIANNPLLGGKESEAYRQAEAKLLSNESVLERVKSLMPDAKEKGLTIHDIDDVVVTDLYSAQDWQ